MMQGGMPQASPAKSTRNANIENKSNHGVEKIIGCKVEQGKALYEVKWGKTWEPADALHGPHDAAVTEYWSWINNMTSGSERERDTSIVSGAIEKIVASKLRQDGVVIYQVKWRASWEPVENLNQVPNIVKEFWARIDRLQTVNPNPIKIKKRKISESNNVMSPKLAKTAQPLGEFGSPGGGMPPFQPQQQQATTPKSSGRGRGSRGGGGPGSRGGRGGGRGGKTANGSTPQKNGEPGGGNGVGMPPQQASLPGMSSFKQEPGIGQPPPQQQQQQQPPQAPQQQRMAPPPRMQLTPQQLSQMQQLFPNGVPPHVMQQAAMQRGGMPPGMLPPGMMAPHGMPPQMHSGMPMQMMQAPPQQMQPQQQSAPGQSSPQIKQEPGMPFPPGSPQGGAPRPPPQY